MDLNIKEIDSIDFGELYDEKPELRRNNRKKIIELSNQLSDAHGLSLPFVCCIADTDFDFFESKMTFNNYLKYTDYSCLEMYFYNEKTLNNFFNKILHSFPYQSDFVLREISKPLVDLFFIRLALKRKLTEFYDDINFIDIKKTISVNRKNGTVSFEPVKHITKILNANNLMDRETELIDYYNNIRLNAVDDNRNQIRGHDFIHLLFLLIDKIKNNIKLKEELLNRVLQVCVCNKTLCMEPLIMKLNKRYSA